MKLNVQHIAKLANIQLDKDEEQKFEKQLSEVLDYVEKLNEVNTENVQPTSHVTGLENVARDDVASQSFSQEEALSNAANEHNGFFKVKAILENN